MPITSPLVRDWMVPPSWFRMLSRTLASKASSFRLTVGHAGAEMAPVPATRRHTVVTACVDVVPPSHDGRIDTGNWRDLMAADTALDVATRYYQAWTTKNIDAAMSYIADDIVCDAP